MRIPRFARLALLLLVCHLTLKALQAQSSAPPRLDPDLSLSDSAPAAETSAAADTDADSAPGHVSGRVKKPDFNDDIYYRNKFEFSLETGALWINTPFIFDVFEGGDYSHNPLHYTLVPLFPSFHWHMGKISGPLFLRGNTDLSVAISITTIPRGPEKIYGAFDLGIRRNFVYRNWRVAPYFEGRLGAGFIDAKERPGINYAGNGYAQGEDYTFTVFVGLGLRYNLSPKYSVALSGNYFHISNAYLSEPMWDDNGINVVGPMIGFYMRIGKPKPPAK